MLRAGVAQSVEQLIRNQQVTGSSPVTSSKNPVCESLRDFFIFFHFIIKKSICQIKKELYAPFLFGFPGKAPLNCSAPGPNVFIPPFPVFFGVEYALGFSVLFDFVNRFVNA